MVNATQWWCARTQCRNNVKKRAACAAVQEGDVLWQIPHGGTHTQTAQLSRSPEPNARNETKQASEAFHESCVRMPQNSEAGSEGNINLDGVGQQRWFMEEKTPLTEVNSQETKQTAH